MFILVLTGGLGAGKSTAAEHFKSKGATVVALDDIGHHVLSPGSTVLARVVEEFGTEILRPDGSVDRSALAKRAFVSPESAARLNVIVHPAIAREVGPALANLRLLERQPDAVVLEVPLLAEAPVYAELADEVLAVVAPMDVRVARAVHSGMDEAEAIRRIRAQATDAERAAYAGTVIENNGDRAEFLRKLDEFWAQRVGV